MADLRELKDRAAEHMRKGRFSKAAEALREIARAEPGDLSTRQKLADALRRAGETAQALATYVDVARSYADDGELIKAIAVCKVILDIDPNHEATQSTLADLYARRRSRPAAATAIVEAVVAREPDLKPVSGSGTTGVPLELEMVGGTGAIPLELDRRDRSKGGFTPVPAPPRARDPFSADPADPFSGYVPPRLPAAELAAVDPTLATARRTPFERIVDAARVAALGAPGEPIGEDEETDEVVIETDDFALDDAAAATPPAAAVAVAAPAVTAPAAVPVAPAPAVAPPPAARTPVPRVASPVAAPTQPPVDVAPPAAPVAAPVVASGPAASPAVPPVPSAASSAASASSPASQPPASPQPRAQPMPRVPLFSDLSRDAFVELARALVRREAAPGDCVVRQGEPGDSFFVVASGQLHVERDDKGEKTVLARLGEGDFFGEMALLSGEPRMASVVADTAAEVLEIAASTLTALCRADPHVAASLTRFYRRRLLANAMITSPVFRPFSRTDRASLARRFRTREVATGEIVVREGAPSDGMYVILSGRFQVRTGSGAGAELVAMLREGDVFGETSCLRKRPANASVVAARPGIVLRLPRAEFDEVAMAHPQVLELVAGLADEREHWRHVAQRPVAASQSGRFLV